MGKYAGKNQVSSYVHMCSLGPKQQAEAEKTRVKQAYELTSCLTESTYFLVVDALKCGIELIL